MTLTLSSTSSTDAGTVDVALIGAGIMSAPLATMLRMLEPKLRMVMLERLDHAATEASDAWNNAGTGHAGYCELNYTPELPDGTVDCAKALDIAAQFALSLELWRALVERGHLPAARTFVRKVPHLSFVEGAADVAFLRARYRGLAASPLFADLEWSDDPARAASRRCSAPRRARRPPPPSCSR